MTRLVRNIFISVIKENDLLQSPVFLEYIAFEFCEDYGILKKELEEQIIKALS